MNWLLDFIPWWVWFVMLGIGLIATYPLWNTLWILLPRPAKVALGIIGGVLAAYFAGRNRGAANERERQKDADANAVKNRLETDKTVRDIPDSDIDKRLGGWLRRD